MLYPIMNLKDGLLFLLIALASVPFFSCTRTVYVPEDAVVQDGKYDTAFPRFEAADQLEELVQSIRMINAIASYKHVTFAEDSRLTRAAINDEVIEEHATHIDFFNDTASGTATVIHHNRERLAFLTSAHIVHFPDTLVFYFENEQDDHQRFVQSIAFKKRQQNYIADIAGADDLDILALDEALDVALLGQAITPPLPVGKVRVFDYPLGDADDLSWGSFVYIIGYPAGVKMITRGLVSKTFRGRPAFLIDAPFNRGFSGGAVLAVRDGAPHFELVGLAMQSASNTTYRLIPPKDDVPHDYDPRVPYDGEIFLERQQEIRYGITICVPINAIRDFVRGHAAHLAEQGYRLRLFE